MPSTRRLRLFIILAVLAIATLVYFTTTASASDRDFYDRTVAALHLKNPKQPLKQSDVDSVAAGARQGVAQGQADGKAAQGQHIDEKALKKEADRVKEEVKEEAKERAAHRKGKGKERQKGGDDDDAGESKKEKGQKVMGEEKEEKEKKPHEVGKSGEKGWNTGKAKEDKEKDKGKESEGKSDEDKEVETQLQSILKRSPIIIFSKTYCPFSKKAKAVFSKYSIVPAPFIVEIDQEPLGPQLQAKLFDMTGRKTVPNVLISGKSIGGGDDVEALDVNDKLIDTVTSMGGKRIVEAKRV